MTTWCSTATSNARLRTCAPFLRLSDSSANARPACPRSCGACNPGFKVRTNQTIDSRSDGNLRTLLRSHLRGGSGAARGCKEALAHATPLATPIGPGRRGCRLAERYGLLGADDEIAG